MITIHLLLFPLIICLLFCHFLLFLICFTAPALTSTHHTSKMCNITLSLLACSWTLLADKYYLFCLLCSWNLLVPVVWLCLPGGWILLATWTPFLYSVCDHPTPDYPCTGTKLSKNAKFFDTHTASSFSAVQNLIATAEDIVLFAKNIVICRSQPVLGWVDSNAMKKGLGQQYITKWKLAQFYKIPNV